MTEPINSQKANHHTPTNLQLVLLVVFVGLILKDCLDTFLKLHPIPVEGLLAYIRALPPADVFQLVVFLFTFLRFVYGAHRFHERERDNPGAIIVALNLLGTVVLFLVLLAGVTLTNQSLSTACSLSCISSTYSGLQSLCFLRNFPDS